MFCFVGREHAEKFKGRFGGEWFEPEKRGRRGRDDRSLYAAAIEILSLNPDINASHVCKHRCCSNRQLRSEMIADCLIVPVIQFKYGR